MGEFLVAREGLRILNNLWWTNISIRYGYDEYSNTFNNSIYYV